MALRHPGLRRGRLLTCRQPSSGAKIMNRFAVPLRWYSIVMPCGVSWLRRDRHARLGDELLRCLVHAHHGTGWMVRPVIHLQHIFHAGYEACPCEGARVCAQVMSGPEHEFANIGKMQVSACTPSTQRTRGAVRICFGPCRQPIDLTGHLEM